ncbi:TetR/AcrR family transcriptional regulator [Streptomyces rugosispiralis]|uniref:TetR/AcrR family transcriptional regulator n=1 Tax=Streptomyces rugosispiralis TaxID=2967341 RepID=A0ABT1UQL5_9ACTN|nr:TetR/AcrR family transcriptional regulator [Streptomyces rugosispiralis]MCQ8187420.1 TetR/AcrR family transcriptional regulator [Streptomyces rugosispiralis]
MGRRERKKAATRQALADAALRLFLDRGFDQVSVRDIAEAADVSTTTVFKHFPSKEALLFDLDSDREAALIAAVRDRPEGMSVPRALCEHTLRMHSDGTDDPEMARFVELTESTPGLREYGRRMLMRHEAALAAAIAETTGVPADDPGCAALAHFALETVGFARGRADARRSIEAAFALLEHGWPAAGQR